MVKKNSCEDWTVKIIKGAEQQKQHLWGKGESISYHSESFSSDRALLWREECTLHTAYISALGESSLLCISCCA